MRNLLLLFFILQVHCSNAQLHIIGSFNDGRQFAITDTLKDADVCSFRLPNGERADWKVELAPYIVSIFPESEEVVLCSAKDTVAIDLRVMPYPRDVWRMANNATKLEDEDNLMAGDHVYHKGRVCCSTASGVRDTLNLVFDVLPTRPKLIDMYLSDFEIDEEYPWASECQVVADVAIQNTSDLLCDYFWLLKPKELETWVSSYKTELSNRVDTVSVDLDKLSYVGNGIVIWAVNQYGAISSSGCYAISGFVKEEPYRKFVDDYLGVEKIQEAPVTIRREGNMIICNSPDVKSMRLLNLLGQLMAHSTIGSRLLLPTTNSHSCYIVVIQLSNKTITKKIQL